METLPEAHRHSAEQSQPPENLHRMAMENDRGEELGSSPTTLIPSQNAISLSSPLPLFYSRRREVVTSCYSLSFQTEIHLDFFLNEGVLPRISSQPTCTYLSRCPRVRASLHTLHLFPPQDGSLHDIRPHLIAHPPVCTEIRLFPEKTGPRLLLAFHLVIRPGPMVVAIPASQIPFIFVRFLKRFDPFPHHWYRQCRSVELREIVGAIVVEACHHIRPEPSP